MKKFYVFLFVLVVGGLATLIGVNQNGNNSLHNNVLGYHQFETEFDSNDYLNPEKISKKYSDDIGLPEWYDF